MKLEVNVENRKRRNVKETMEENVKVGEKEETWIKRQ